MAGPILSREGVERLSRRRFRSRRSRWPMFVPTARLDPSQVRDYRASVAARDPVYGFLLPLRPKLVPGAGAFPQAPPLPPSAAGSTATAKLPPKPPASAPKAIYIPPPSKAPPLGLPRVYPLPGPSRPTTTRTGSRLR